MKCRGGALIKSLRPRILFTEMRKMKTNLIHDSWSRGPDLKP